MDHTGRSIHCGLLQFGMMTAQGSSLSHAVFSTSRRFIRGQMGARDTTPIIFGCIDSDARIPEPGEWTISTQFHYRHRLAAFNCTGLTNWGPTSSATPHVRLVFLRPPRSSRAPLLAQSVVYIPRRIGSLRSTSISRVAAGHTRCRVGSITALLGGRASRFAPRTGRECAHFCCLDWRSAMILLGSGERASRGGRWR